MDNIFDRFLDSADRAGIELRTKQSTKWFIDLARNKSRSYTFDKLEKEAEGKFRKELVPGKMYMYAYDAKTKDTLPYWDKYPLIILLGISKKHFLGLNLHYLAPKQRAIILAKLMEILNNSTFAERTKIKITYEMVRDLPRYKVLQPTIKLYLKKQVRSKFILVDPEEWEIAIALPTQKFVGAGAARVYTDSRNKIK